MFARTCPRMGMRFASGNVYYMNRTFTARHLQCVGSPLAAGFVSPMRMMSTSTGIAACGMGALMPSGLLDLDSTSALKSAAAECAIESMSAPSIVDLPMFTMFANLAKAPYTWGDVQVMTMESAAN
jgi:hypothetical protein